MRSSGSAGMRIVIVDRRVHEEQRQCRYADCNCKLKGMSNSSRGGVESHIFFLTFCGYRVMICKYRKQTVGTQID